MADKKITELTELTSLDQGDLFVVVDNPTGIPITKKIKAQEMFGGTTGVTFVTNTSFPARSVIKSTLTANVNTTATTSVLTAGEFTTTATTGSANTPYQYGILATSRLEANTSNVKTEHAAAKFVLDVGNAVSLITNTYGCLIVVANTTGVRTQNTQAFLAVGDTAFNSNTAQTKYLFDIGLNGSANVSANVSASSGNVSTLLSRTAATTPSHKLRITSNGTDYFILVANSSVSNI